MDADKTKKILDLTKSIHSIDQNLGYYTKAVSQNPFLKLTFDGGETFGFTDEQVQLFLDLVIKDLQKKRIFHEEALKTFLQENVG